MASKKKADISLVASVDSDEDWQELIMGKEVEFWQYGTSDFSRDVLDKSEIS